MTRKPSPKSDESKKSKREAGREVKTEQRTKALKTTLKKAADKDPPKELKGAKIDGESGSDTRPSVECAHQATGSRKAHVMTKDEIGSLFVRKFGDRFKPLGSR